METESMDEIPASEEPVQVTEDDILLEEESTRVLKPEMQEDRVAERDSVIPQFDLTKLSYDVQQGYRIYVELLADSNRNVTWPFLEPVDADSLGLWDYYKRVKEPMCFATIGCKFTDYMYQSITEVVGDMRLILENCYRYNGPGHWVSKLGQKLEKILEQKLALLNRSLRDKVTLLATMSLNGEPSLAVELEASGRRRSSRQNYLSMVNGENSSSLVNHVKIQEESEEKERRKQREKDKKEANQALLQDLVEWEIKELTPEIMKPIHSMWEIPSIGSFLYLVKNILGLEDINLAEFELSFIYPNKSSLLAKIFTALLITPHQRKSLYKKPVMKFRRWESKLKEKLDAWYKLADKDSLYAVSIQYGIDLKFFDILGKEKNPLEEKSYLDLTLHQRIWLLKSLCDVCFHKDYDLREKVNSCDFMEQRELFLGHDAKNRSYIYFPVFQSTDIRIYQHDQLEIPKLSTKTKKETSPPATPTPETKKARKTPSRPPTPSKPARSLRLRQLRSDFATEDNDEQEDTPNPASPETNKTESKPDLLPEFVVKDGFKLACHDIETLKALAEQFAEPPIPPKKRGRRPKPPPSRKQCDVDLHETLMALLQELEKYEGIFSRNYTKARIKIMKESLEPEAVEEPEEVPEPETIEEWGSELSDEDDGAKRDTKDEDYIIEDRYGKRTRVDSKLSKLDNEISNESENSSVKSIQTTSPRHKRKRKSSEENTEIPSSTSCNIGIQTPNPRMKKKAKKWSPMKESQIINSKSVSSPAVVISAVSAEESVKAATEAQKGVSVVKTLSAPSSSEVHASLSPEKILLNSLSESLKRAKSTLCSSIRISAVVDSSSIVDSSRIGVEGISTQGKSTSDLISKTSQSSSATTSLQAQNLRKRILVSPEGKAHEVKPCITIECTSSLTPAITPSIHPPIQRKTAVQIITSVKGEVTTSGIGATPITDPRALAKVPQNRPTLSMGSTTPGSTPRPNILSHSRKQIPGKTGIVTPSVSHNHTYAIPSASVNQGTATLPTGLGMDKVKAVTPTVKMVQIIPNSTPLYAAPSTTMKPGGGVNTLLKPVGGPGQSGLALPKAIIASNVLSHPKTLPVASSQVSSQTASTLSKTAVVSKGTVSVTAKTLASKQMPGQTKVVFIPASSVDEKSPLASFKPQTLTTTNGQSIYGYAVVVPPGSPEQVNAVISSALGKPITVPGKSLSIPTQQTQQQMTATGKIANAIVTGKTVNVSQLGPVVPTSSTLLGPGVATSTSKTVNASQLRPVVHTSSTQPRPVVSISSTSSRPGVPTITTQPRPGVPTITTQSRPVVPTIATQPRPVVSISSTSSSPGVATITSQSRPSVATSTLQPRPGVPTSSTSPHLVSPNGLTQPQTNVATTTTQSRPGVPTSTSQPRPVVATSTSHPRTDVPAITTQLRPAVPTSSTTPRFSAPTSTTQPRPVVATTTTQSRTDVPAIITQLRPAVPTSSTTPRFSAQTTTTQPRTDVSAITTQLRPVVSTSSTPPRLGAPTNTTQSRADVATSPTTTNAKVTVPVDHMPRLGAETNPQSRTISNTPAPLNANVSVGKSTAQACSLATTSQKLTVIDVPASVHSKAVLGLTSTQPRLGVATSLQTPNVINVPVNSKTLLGSIATQPRLGVATTPQNPTITNAPVSVNCKASLGSSATQPRLDVAVNSSASLDSSATSQKPTVPNSQLSIRSNVLQGPSIKQAPCHDAIKVQATSVCSSVQNSPVPLPKAPPVGISTKVTDLTPTNQQTLTSNAKENGQNPSHTDINLIESNNEVKNGPLNNSNAPTDNARVVAQTSETVNVSAGHSSNNEPRETNTKLVQKQTTSPDETYSPIGSAKLHSDKLTVDTEVQKIVTYCNGVSDHSSLKSIDSIQNMKHIESNTPLTDVSSANGIPENSGTSPRSSASTSN